MNTYVKTTGVLFGLLTLVHLLRILQEGTQVAKDPWYTLMTLTSAILCLWAWRLRHGDR